MLVGRVTSLAPTVIFTRRDGPFTPPDLAVSEMHEALARGTHRPPFLFVAASFAGFTALRFAQRFPELLHSLVLVDSSHPRQSAALLAALSDIIPASPELDAFKTFLRGFGPVWEDSCALLDGDNLLRDLPIIVLAAGTQQVPASLPADTKRSLILTWHALQREHAARSSRGELRIVDGAGHAIAQQAPEAVVQAIVDLLSKDSVPSTL